MKFGYFTLTDNPPAYGERRRDPSEIIREVLEQCVEAEAMGFHSAWVPEHHLGLFGVLPSPWILLAAVAARTTRSSSVRRQLSCRSIIPCVSLRSATCWTKSAADERFLAGRGYDQREYAAFDAVFENSRDVFA